MQNQPETSDKSFLPLSAIDGAKIKSLRETKKLTQLYVASVVGVTTDTISRWENNRYPTIKRDNAEKLAAALEVDLTEILRQEVAEEVPIEKPDDTSRSPRRLIFIAAAVLAVVVAGLLFLRQPGKLPGAERRLPRFAAPGEVIPVQVRINRQEGAGNGVIVKEHLPPGWRLVQAIPSPATSQAGAEEVKWLIPSGTGPATISYSVMVSPVEALQTLATFSGEVIGHGTGKTACGGDRTVTIAAVHWADRNGDGRIDDDEIMPAYYLTEEMKGLDLGWKTIEAIWSGKGYRWDPGNRTFQVIR